MYDPAVDRTVDLRGLTFHYREYGSDGPALVLLHGVASTSRIWLLAGPMLGERCRVYALDQRGHGESDKPDGGYDFPSVADDLDAFIKTLGLERPVVVGHSWGGNVALEYAATQSDRVAGLVLCDGGFLELSSRPGMTWEKAEHDMAPPDLTHLPPAELIEMAKRWELGPMWSDEIEAGVLANFEVTEAGTLRARLSRANHMQVVRALWEQRPSELHSRVTCPVLFVVAEREGEGRAREWMAMKREAIARAEAQLPDCRVVWMPDTIHDIPLQRPRELSDVVTQFALGLK